MQNPVTLAFLGDLMLGRKVTQNLPHRSPEWFWGDALPHLRAADAVIANLESPITTSGERQRRGWKTFHFKADPEAVKVLSTGNVRFVCLANNHILDYGDRGLVETIGILDRAGIAHAGAGRNLAEAQAPCLFDAAGLKLGLLAATDNVREFSAAPDSPGTNYFRFGPASPGLDWIAREVAALRRQGVTTIVLSLHWGPNMRKRPSRAFRAFAHAAIERGVDVIHGHSAHVVHGIERHGRGVILYDTGNFIDDYWKFPFRRTVWSFVFKMIFENGRPAALRLIPVLTNSAPLSVSTGEVFKATISYMQSHCAAFGTQARESEEGLEIALA